VDSLHAVEHTVSRDDHHSALTEQLGRTASNNAGFPDEKAAQSEYLKDTLTWLDITVSITAGSAPRLPCRSFYFDDSEARSHDEAATRYKVLAINQMGRIAALWEHRSHTRDHGDCPGPDIVALTEEIERDLQRSHMGFPSDAVLTSQNSRDAADARDRFVAKIFFQAASVYYHLVRHGFLNVDDLIPTDAEAVEMLRYAGDHSLLPALACPLFIFAVGAQPEAQATYRAAFSSLALLDKALRHRQWIAPVLNDIWKERRSRPDYGWMDVLKLTQNILII
jgi:C6 transcription factor Pro1